MNPQGISTAEKGNNAEFIRKADDGGVLGYRGNLTDWIYEKESIITGKVCKKSNRKLKTVIQQNYVAIWQLQTPQN